jgi:hypothetical protein
MKPAVVTVLPQAPFHALLEIANSHPEVLRLIINCMPEGGAACLRLVNRSLRLAVNRTVTTVTCAVSAGLPQAALDAAFPTACHLRVILLPDADPHTSDMQDTETLDDTAANDDAAVHSDAAARNAAAVRASEFIEGLWHSSPGLLGKISVLDIILGAGLSAPAAGSAVAELVSRYGLGRLLLLPCCFPAALPLLLALTSVPVCQM